MEDGDKIDKIIKIRRLKPRGISTDVLVLSPQEILDPIYKEMLISTRRCSRIARCYMMG